MDTEVPDLRLSSPNAELVATGRVSGWVKIKNRDYWRYEIEREGAIRHSAKRHSQLVSR